MSTERALRAAFDSISRIPDGEWAAFWPQVRSHRFAAREHLVREGRPATRVYFVVSGLVRLYHNHDGRELVSGFDYENRFTTAYESVVTGEPATYSIETLEPTHALSFTGSVLQSMYARDACWERFGRLVLEMDWIRRADKNRRFRIYTPEEHYRVLIARQSPLIDRVPLHQLASFLQIAPETLSRIRARMREQAMAEEPSAAT